MIRGILTVIILTLIFGGFVKGLGLLTDSERIRVVRQGFFWTAMAIIAALVTFFITVSF